MSWRSRTLAHPQATGALLGAALLAGAALFLLPRQGPLAPALPFAAAGAGDEAAPAPYRTRWTVGQVGELLDAAEGAAAEGLDPADYADPALRRAVRDGATGRVVDEAADRAAAALARDYRSGRIRDPGRFGWHVQAPAPSRQALAAELDRARAEGRLRPWLRSLLPTAPAYLALRRALAVLPAVDPRRAPILANMERWRWMPRELGRERHLWVNVPSQRVSIVEGGVESGSHVAVVGAPRTPTPAVSAVASTVIVNPWWTVPGGMIRRGEVPTGRAAARRGYVVTRAGGGWRIRQRPGPGNALGRVKLEMPNAYAIYLHDTPAKGAFAAADRARSHGCIRVKDIDRLAQALAADPAPVAKALSGRATRQVALGRGWPVWVVYFTLDLDPATGELAALPDIYRRDAALVTALTGVAPRPIPAPEPTSPPPAPMIEPAAASVPGGTGEPDAAPDPVPAAPVELAPAPPSTDPPSTDPPSADPPSADLPGTDPPRAAPSARADDRPTLPMER